MPIVTQPSALRAGSDGSMQNVKRKKLRFSPLRTIVLGFLVIILMGTALLMLPFASRAEGGISFITAAFTATSATCVTGLTVAETLSTWTLFGQLVILTMIQIGGLGVMSMAVVLALLLSGRVSPRENLIVSQSVGLSGSEGAATGFMKIIVCGTFGVEAFGALILSTQLIPVFGWGEGIYKSIFHSVSAFCNAGFDIFGGYNGGASLSAFSSNPVVLCTISGLVITGGIGFLVWADIIALLFSRRRGRLSAAESIHSIAGRVDKLSVYTKFVLIVTAALLIGGTALTAALEWNHALAGMSTGDKLLNSFFQSVTLRTAGFFSFDNGTMSEGGQFLAICLMFIGGCSGSTAGGVKVSTVGLLFYSVVQIFTGHEEIVLFKRKINRSSVLRAMSLVIVGEVIIAAASACILITNPISAVQAVYETTSAYATVGLTLGITSVLDTFGKLILMVLMFFGRVGVLTVSLSFIQKGAGRRNDISRPETQFLIG